MAANKVWAFTTIADTTPPTVSSTVPADLATNVAISTVVTATFSEAMDATTISGTTFTLKTTSGSVAVAGSVSYDAGTRKATFTPTSPLANNTNYTATVTTGVKDAAGNAMAANKVWTFTTIADTTPPIVSSTTPADNATGVAITAVVTATFSEAMDATTISGTTFTLKTTSGSIPVAGSVAYDAGTKTATFTPTLALATNTVYTATITTGAKDAAGNALAANKVWAFTTVP
jgi:methionine-rich copper-binding protein CopC